MRTIRVEARTALSADAAFDRIRQFEDEWTVPFRGRSIHWRQRSEPAPSERRISFTQTVGDFRSLSGVWRTIPASEGCEVVLEVTYDVGVPIYDRILDPLIERVLTRAARSAISGF
ncbi:SRPBCC family protein [Micromonospora sp. NBC_00330]|uniref:type II toxin-antitoxin system RatA family toxin n=1 Tax=Micromonospora sp. NBC_00330 TaxID=2903585 RepID=UPI002E2B91FD|nr:SRPBCC family protein [Micromonospora sp. NBC_00330]